VTGSNELVELDDLARDAERKLEHEAAVSRIRRAIATMPYGGLVHGGRLSSPYAETRATVRLDDVADYLERLSAVLSSVAAGADADRRDLEQARHDLASVRRVGVLLGLTPPDA
jgi:hypothetical protein